MNKEELIKSLERAPVHDVVASIEEADPNAKIDKYTLLGKLNEVLAWLKENAVSGTTVNVAGIPQEIIDFVSDPQNQINDINDLLNSKASEESVALLVDAVTRLDLDITAIRENTVQIGHSNGSFTAGNTPHLAGVNAICIGATSDAQNEAVCVGHNTLANAECVAIGHDAVALDGVAIGHSADANHGSICIGDSALSGADKVIQLGRGYSTTPNSVNVYNHKIADSSTGELFSKGKPVVNQDDIANKQDYFTYKYEGDFNVADIDDFRTKVYEQRKNTVRRWQLEINPYNIDLMSVLGYPDDGISSADKAYLYIHVPYSEAGGFEIDLKLMKRDGSRVFERYMTSTLNSNWHDSGWRNIEETALTPEQIKNINDVPNKAQIKRLFYGSASTVANLNENYRNYDFIIIQVSCNNRSLIGLFNVSVASFVAGCGLTEDALGTYGFHATVDTVESRTITLDHIGFFSGATWNERLNRNAYGITNVYGVKGVKTL